MNALSMLLENSPPAKRGSALVTGELSELFMNGEMVHGAMTLLLKTSMADIALKRTSPLMHGTDMFVQVKLLRESRCALVTREDTTGRLSRLGDPTSRFPLLVRKDWIDRLRVDRGRW